MKRKGKKRSGWMGTDFCLEWDWPVCSNTHAREGKQKEHGSDDSNVMGHLPGGQVSIETTTTQLTIPSQHFTFPPAGALSTGRIGA